ncbi:MAG: Uncharacterised protein [Cryomorphaceae bacterium]|nr:MAG: Uncharacterised protein [Cryomorphaceae bacterium]
MHNKQSVEQNLNIDPVFLTKHRVFLSLWLGKGVVEVRSIKKAPTSKRKQGLGVMSNVDNAAQ